MRELDRLGFGSGFLTLYKCSLHAESVSAQPCQLRKGFSASSFVLSLSETYACLVAGYLTHIRMTWQQLWKDRMNPEGDCSRVSSVGNETHSYISYLYTHHPKGLFNIGSWVGKFTRASQAIYEVKKLGKNFNVVVGK